MYKLVCVEMNVEETISGNMKSGEILKKEKKKVKISL
jgi:hypothetical protein